MFMGYIERKEWREPEVPFYEKIAENIAEKHPKAFLQSCELRSSKLKRRLEFSLAVYKVLYCSGKELQQ